MNQDNSFPELMSRLRLGDEEAARRVFTVYTSRLIALARSRLGLRMQPKVDPEDVLQSVYKSFFLRHARGQLTPHSWDSLWAVLTVITLRKCHRWVERFHTAMRHVGNEVRVAGGHADSSQSWPTAAADPTPEEAAILTETVDHLLQGLEERERRMVHLALQGHTVIEIADHVGRTRRTVQRVLARVKDQLQERADQPDID